MQCRQCLKENPSQAKFCLECGTRFALTCANCGTTLPEGANFCLECGHPMTQTDGTISSSQPKFVSPETYTPKYLAERILTSKSGLEGERKQVTVLFADLKGSTELIAEWDPEEVRSLLDEVVDRMMVAVHRYEGTVNQIMGDGIMALFGAPIAHEDHALRACYAAIAMQEGIGKFGEETLRSRGVPVKIRVGLNSGEVIVRTIQNDLRMDYSAIGQTTHLAARMEQTASPGCIHLTAETLRLAEGFIQVNPLGPVPIKGIPEPMEVFELTGATSVRRRFQITAAGGLTRFVGRQNEMEVLQKALGKAGEGHGQVFATVAEAGVGKSRLYWEFTHSHRTENWTVIESGSVSYGKATAYKPVIDLLKAYFSIDETDDHRQIREKVTGKVLTLDESLTSAIPPVLSLLELPVEDSGWQNLDPPKRRQRTLEGVKRLLLREAEVQPLVVVFEDLHWIDSETQAFLDSLVESLPGARVLLLVNYRPEYEHGWANKTYYTHLRLGPLSSEGAEDLLQTILGMEKALDPLKKILIERTGGNPFYLEESVQTLIESGALAGRPGGYRLMQKVSEIRVPSTVQAILAARMDRLPLDEKRLLQTASVIGTNIPYSLLLAISEISEEEMNKCLVSLQSAEFLYETNIFPEREFTFKHALTHEVTYGSLVKGRKRALHNAIVQEIETCAENIEEHFESLAYHSVQGEVWEKALIYHRQAGAKSVARSANRQAAQHFEQALHCLGYLPESSETLEQAVDIRLDLRNSLLPSGEFKFVLDILREAEKISARLADRHRMAAVSTYLTHYYWWLNMPEQAVETGRSARKNADALGDLGLETAANLWLGCAYHSLGKYQEAIKLLRKNVTSLQGELLQERFGLLGLPSVLSRHMLTRCLSELGDFQKGITIGEEAIEIADRADNPFSLSAAYMGLGFLHIRKGEFKKATPLLQRVLAISQSADLPIRIPWAASDLGYALTMEGNLSEGLSYLRQAVEHAEEMKIHVDQPLRLTGLSETLLKTGRIDDALQLAKRALQISHSALDPWLNHLEAGNEAWSLRLLGEIYAHPDAFEPVKAEDCYRKGLENAIKLGMRPLTAHCRKGLGILYQKTEAREESRSELHEAAELYRSMEMNFWMDEVHTLLARVN